MSATTQRVLGQLVGTFNAQNQLIGIAEAGSTMNPLQLAVSAPAASSNLTVGASPFIYQNTTDFDQTVVVTGGTVSAVDFTRDGSTFFTHASSTVGQVHLSKGDKVRVTYSVLPTVTVIPR